MLHYNKKTKHTQCKKCDHRQTKHTKPSIVLIHRKIMHIRCACIEIARRVFLPSILFALRLWAAFKSYKDSGTLEIRDGTFQLNRLDGGWWWWSLDVAECVFWFRWNCGVSKRRVESIVARPFGQIASRLWSRLEVGSRRVKCVRFGWDRWFSHQSIGYTTFISQVYTGPCINDFK